MTDDLTGKIVIGDHDETTNSFNNNSDGEEWVVPHVHPEAVSTGVGRAQESNNGGLTVPPHIVGIKCGAVRTYTTEKGGDRGDDDNMWCHLKPSRNPELPSMVGVEGKAPPLFTKAMTTADGDDKIDNDRREKRSSNNTNSFKPSSEACSSPSTATSSVASMSSCSRPASSRLILPNQAMLPSCHECHCMENKHITFGTFDQQYTDPISGLPPSKFEHEVVSFLRLRWEKAQFLSIIESV